MKVVFDVGGTNTRIGVWNGKYFQTQDKFKTTLPQDLYKKLQNIQTSLGNTLDIKGAIAGVVQGNALSYAPNLDPAWLDETWVRNIEELTKGNFNLINDVSAGAIGEARYGAGQFFDGFMYLAIGTGFGSAIVRGGKLIDNEFGFEVGHMKLQVASENNTTVEKYFSGSGVRTLYNRPAYEIADRSFWLDRSHDLVDLTINLMLSTSITNFVMGGSMVLGSPSYELGFMRQVIKKKVAHFKFIDSVNLYRASLGDSANLYGLVV